MATSLIAVHQIIRSKDTIQPGQPFTESADEAEHLISTGAAVRGAAAAVAVAAVADAKPAKGGKKPAAEPELDGEDI